MRSCARVGWLGGWALAWVVFWPAATARAEPPPESPKWCTPCHQDARFSEKVFGKSVHGDNNCRECHTGYQFNPHEDVEEPEIDESVKDGRGGNPAAITACLGCHEDQANEFRESKHGKAFFEDKREGAPFCLDCHGDLHEMKSLSAMPPNARRLLMNERCAACHADAKKMGDKGPKPVVVETYEHSFHGRKLHLGSPKAPGCADCHGSHALTDMKQDRAKKCGECHSGSTVEFSDAFAHSPEEREVEPIAYWGKKFFVWLTFLTIFALMAHVLLDLASQIWRKRNHKPLPPQAEKAVPAEVQRFDVHQRLQHGLMALSFTMLVLTGLPLRAHTVDASLGVARMFGGIDLTGLVHRVSAVGLIIASVYHLGYLVYLVVKGRLGPVMAPTPKDVKDVIDNLLYFLRLRDEKPRFARFSYFEKFDYWAVFWGVVIMVSSGFVLWFPVWTAKFVPGWVFTIMRVAHADEAILAALAIFLWHFYNVHLRPAVFPMSWVFITGRMTREVFEEEHGAEFDAMLKAHEAANAPPPPTPPADPAAPGGKTP
ncbi:MAG: hypothetical protein HY904_04040 [Deltaproteobacteria bacterium]|nr:hypothetical protein [Deltaproteobacteria bacterium]